MQCPKCQEDCHQESVDVGVGTIYGPWGCICGWSEWPEYDSSNGPSPASLEHPDYYVDSCGGMQRKSAIAEKLDYFGLDGQKIIEEYFNGNSR